MGFKIVVIGGGSQRAFADDESNGTVYDTGSFYRGLWKSSAGLCIKSSDTERCRSKKGTNESRMVRMYSVPG